MDTEDKLSQKWRIADRIVLLVTAVICFGVIALACCAILYGLMVYALWAEPNSGSAAKKACALARLAPVPGNILREENRHNMFAGTSYVSFQATEAEIKEWIDASPGLKVAKITTYTKSYVLKSGLNESPAHDKSVDIHVTYATWFAPSSRNGDKYEVPSDDHANYGTVYVDWDTGTVWIEASHS